MLRNPRRSDGELATRAGTIGGLCCHALAPAAQPLLTTVEKIPMRDGACLPPPLDNSALSNFGLSASAEARPIVMPLPETRAWFAFGLGASLNPGWTGAYR